MSDHARLSPSNHRWPRCAGSVEAESVYPDISGEAAIDGTGSHLLLEICIEQSIEPHTLVGQKIGIGHVEKSEGWHVDAARADRVLMALNYIERRKKELRSLYPFGKIEILVEQKVNPGEIFGRDDWYGTADIIIKVTDGASWRVLLVEVVDYKDGRLFVSAEDNSQLQSYALGAAGHYLAFDESKLRLERKHEDWDFNVRMTIVQPKSSTPIRYSDIKSSELCEVGNELVRAAKRTDDFQPPLTPDNEDGNGYCRWCKHRDNCPALKSGKMEKLKSIQLIDASAKGDLFELLQSPLDKLHQLSGPQLSEMMDAKAVVEGLLKAIEEEVQSRLEAGEKVGDYGMVPGRVTKMWNEDDEFIAKMLSAKRLRKSDIWVTKLASPSQILKHPKLTADQKERVKKFVTEKGGKLKVGKVKRQMKNAKTLFAPKINFF